MGPLDWLRRLLGIETEPERAAPTGLRLTVNIGVNSYRDSPENTLRGCVTDAIHWRKALSGLGARTHGPMLLDGQATRAACVSAISSLAHALRSGDTGIVTWSSHGTLAEDQRESDGWVEALCPTDAMLAWPRNLLTLRDLLGICAGIADGARVILFLDACHSGIDPSQVGQYRALSLRGDRPESYRRPRSLIAPFGHQAPRDARVSRLGVGEVETRWQRTVLWSGCRSEQTSADTYEDGQYQGAATWSALRVLARGRTLREVHSRQLGVLTAHGYAQVPQLEGAAAHRALTFG